MADASEAPPADHRGLSLYDLATLVSPPRRPQQHDIAERWKLNGDDVAVRHVQEKLDLKWKDWQPEQREGLLVAVERIAQVERQKRVWNPQQISDRYQLVCKAAHEAATLAATLEEIFPAPWKEEQRRVKALIGELQLFAVGTCRASVFPEIVNMAAEASAELSATRRSSAPPWELMGELVRLIQGRDSINKVDAEQADFTQRVRRYLSPKRNGFKTPGFRFWKRDKERRWKAVAPFAAHHSRNSEQEVSAFEKLALKYLDPSPE